MKRSALMTVMFAFGLTALAQDGKAELRYALQKGEKVAFTLTHGLRVGGNRAQNVSLANRR